VVDRDPALQDDPVVGEAGQGFGRTGTAKFIAIEVKSGASGNNCTADQQTDVAAGPLVDGKQVF